MRLFPFKPIRAEAFSCYLSLEDYTSNVTAGANLSSVTWKTWLSKDNGVFANTVNSPTVIDNTNGRGAIKLDLTAAEMDAETIILTVQARNAGDDGHISNIERVIIYTTPVEESLGIDNFTSSFLNVLIDAIGSNYHLHDYDLALNGYNYYGLMKISTQWFIVKENISTKALTYAVHRSGVNYKKYDQGWLAKTALEYTSQKPV